MHVCQMELGESECGLHEARKGGWAVLPLMYRIANCLAAAVTSKNKGVFMSSLTDLAFINVLPPFLSHHHQLSYVTQLLPIILTQEGALETTLISFTFVSHPSTHTHAQRGASLRRLMYSPREDEAHRQAFIPTWVLFFFCSPWAIYTLEKVNCLKHQQCYFSWIQKHCIWY